MTEFVDLATFGHLGRTDGTPNAGIQAPDHDAFGDALDNVRAAGVTLEAEVDALTAQLNAFNALALFSDAKPYAGMYVPRRSLTRFKYSRRRQRRVTWIGDSITQGTVRGASFGQGSTGCFPERVGVALAREHGGLISYGLRGLWLGDGSGGLPTVNGPEWSVPVGSAAWSAFPGFSTSTADVAPYAEAFTNVGGTQNQLKWTMPAGWTDTAVGFFVYYVDNRPSGNSKFSVSNNNGATWSGVTNQVSNSGKLMRAYFALPVTPGNAVLIRCATNTGVVPGGQFTFAGIEPCIVQPMVTAGSSIPTYGMVYDNLGRDGFSLLNWTRESSIGDPQAFLNAVVANSTEPQLTTDLVVCGFSNDVVTSGDVTRFTNELGLLKARTDASGADLIVWSPFEQSGRDYTLQATYRAQTKAWAIANSVPYLDVYEAWQKMLGYSSVGGAGWTAANAEGLMGDTVHPSAVGCIDMASRFIHLIDLAT